MRVWRGERVLPPGQPQERAVLCALLLRQGKTVTRDELVDAVWGEHSPPRAIAALRTYAFRLRKALGPGALVSDAGGYAVRLAPQAMDLTECEALETRAKRARAEGDLPRARNLLRRAAALWSGEPLAGVPGPYAYSQRGRLAQWRLALLEARVELDLELGLHTEVVSELTTLCAEDPLRERPRTLLMLALYRSGRRTEALGVYNDTRRLLADELGLDPSPELAQLHQRILRADPTLVAPQADPAGGGTARPATPRPAQLPAALTDFTGRTTIMETIREQLLRSQGTVTAISALRGGGGVGKTTLAVHIGHAVRDHYPDGQLYANLLGHSNRPADPEAVLGAFLRALGTAPDTLPEGIHELAALYRSTLVDRRVLVLLDNAHNAAQIRPLLPGTASCAVLITSRTRLTDLDGAHLVDLDVMDPQEALALFTRIIGSKRAAAEPGACHETVVACGFLPLAIRITAARLAARPAWNVSLLTHKLADERRRLHELRAGDLGVEASFQLSHRQLQPRQARAFRLLALADGPDISLTAAAAVLATDTDEAEYLLESLVDASLLESKEPGRYQYHDLVRLFARGCADEEETTMEQKAALARLLDFYLASAAHAYALRQPGDPIADFLQPTKIPGLSFLDQATALAWTLREAECLLACAAQASEGDSVRPAADLLLITRDLCESGMNSHQYKAAAITVRDAARAAGNPRAEGRACVNLSYLYWRENKFRKAETEARRVAHLTTLANDPVPAGNALTRVGIIDIYKKRYKEAEELFLQARTAFQTANHITGVASALCNLSRVHLAMGHTDSAIELATQGVELHSSEGSSLRVGYGRYELGIALFVAERLTEALRELSQALEIFSENKQRLWMGSTHFRLAELQLAIGNPAEAAGNADKALELGLVNGQWGSVAVLRVLGQALDRLEQKERARACWCKALAIHEQSGLDPDEAALIKALLGPLADKASRSAYPAPERYHAATAD
ncbi:BTAD domain-containing putative transcriptional regulator [Streptomyces iranensis]|uniref:AfsR/SARP family transcriptional regulator n=1 Tax=Streptomyces iranensis TaxID=576784 RepID=UPI0039B78E87